MFKLLKAGLFRLRKSKVFWAILVLSVIAAGASIYFGINAEKHYFDAEEGVDTTLIRNIIFISFFITVFISLFTGVERSERHY